MCNLPSPPPSSSSLTSLSSSSPLHLHPLILLFFWSRVLIFTSLPVSFVPHLPLLLISFFSSPPTLLSSPRSPSSTSLILPCFSSCFFPPLVSLHLLAFIPSLLPLFSYFFLFLPFSYSLPLLLFSSPPHHHVSSRPLFLFFFSSPLLSFPLSFLLLLPSPYLPLLLQVFFSLPFPSTFLFPTLPPPWLLSASVPPPLPPPLSSLRC